MTQNNKKENTIKKTFKELSEIDSVMASIYEKNPEYKDGKFGYAYKRFAEKNWYPVLKEYQNEILDIRIDNALTDEKTKAILTTEKGRGFEFDKEGLKAVLKAERELEKKWDIKEFEVEPYICKKENLIELTDEQKDLLKGILI